MGLLGSLAEKLVTSELGGGGGQSQQQNALEGVMALLNHPSVGGVAGLSQLFQNAGLGHLVSGWISNGPNPSVTPAQLQQVLGSGPIAAFAQKLGISPDEAASHLAQLLPHVVDHLTPNGTAPQGNVDVQSAVAALKTKLFG